MSDDGGHSDDGEDEEADADGMLVSTLRRLSPPTSRPMHDNAPAGCG